MPQVDPSHYNFREYDHKGRWVSYWHQIDEVLSAGALNCAEVGTGSGVVNAVLRLRGIEMVTIDFDPALNPDRVGDLRRLPADDDEFDVVLCCQVLEHLPFEDVPQALRELGRIARQRLVVSVPRSGRVFEVRLKVPAGAKLAWSGITPARKPFAFDGEHYWQAGATNYPLSLVRRVFQEALVLERDFQVPEYPYHHFFVMRPRKVQ